MNTKDNQDPALEPARILRPKNESALPHPRNFQGIPGIAASEGNLLHAVWYGGGGGEGPDNFVMLSRSRDGGTTWSGIESVIHHDHPLTRTYDPVVWTAPDGSLWLFYAQAAKWWDGRAGVWAVNCRHPDAVSMKWSAPRRIADGVMMNKPTVTRDGRWLLPVAVWSHAPCTDPARPGRFVPEEFNRWGSVTPGAKVVVSQDQGANFQVLGSLAVDDVRFHEHMLVEKKDGTLWMLIRGIHGMLDSLSSDGGASWTAATTSSIPHIDSRFFIRRLASGKLLLIRHLVADEYPPAQETEKSADGETKQPERAFLSAFLSADDGSTWSGSLMLDERMGVSYPDGDQLSDGSIVITYDYNRYRDKVILMARFREEDVTAGRIISPGSALRLSVNQAPVSANTTP